MTKEIQYLLKTSSACTNRDGGVGWKHNNPRTDNPSLTRARNLIVQSIITVGNYEYIFAWIFWQNGNLELETRLTGILSTQLIDPGKTSEWGTVVSPGVLAANHQHLFSFRIDPMMDGQFNSIIQEDSVAVPHTEEENPHGNAWDDTEDAVREVWFRRRCTFRQSSFQDC